MENARIVSDNACFGFHRAFCLTDFTSCQYEIATCNEDKFDTSPPDLDKVVQIQQKPKYGFFTKTRFFSKKLVFFSLDLQFFGSLKLLVYIYIYVYISYITKRMILCCTPMIPTKLVVNKAIFFYLRSITSRNNIASKGLCTSKTWAAISVAVLMGVGMTTCSSHGAIGLMSSLHACRICVSHCVKSSYSRTARGCVQVHRFGS